MERQAHTSVASRRVLRGGFHRRRQALQLTESAPSPKQHVQLPKAALHPAPSPKQ